MIELRVKQLWRARLVLASVIAVVACLANQPAYAALDYSQSLGADFYDTYPQAPDPLNVFVNGLPSTPIFGPNSEWELLDPGTGSSANLMTTSAAPFSGQNGWCVNDGTGACSTAPPTSYFGSNWQPGVTLPVADGMMNGHGPQSINWTAPASVDEGAISLEGSIQQIFGAADGRQVRLAIFKNGSATPSFSVDAVTPANDSGIPPFPIQVDFGPSLINVSPGDVLNLVVDGNGTNGNGIGTFTAWNVTFTEAVPEPASATLFAAASISLFLSRRRIA